MSFDSPNFAPQMPGAPAAPPAFGQDKAKKKPKGQSQQPSFLGTDTTPTQGQLGQKTLLGT